MTIHFPHTRRSDTLSSRVFGIDPRALAAFRIGLGILLLIDLWVRAADLGAHYALGRVVSDSALQALRPWAYPSLHALSSAIEWQVALFVIAALLAVALAVGYRSRLAAFGSWMLLLSLHHANPLINNSGDSILLLMLLWGGFLPLGTCLSLDARRRGTPPAEGPVFSIATAGVLLQLYAVYLTSIFHKTGATWRSDFTAVYYTLELDAFTTAFGKLVGDAPLPVLQALTIATLVLEGIGPLIAMSPWRSATARTLVALSFIGFHAGLAASMTLGIFPFVCMVGWLLVIPSPVWQAVFRRARSLGPLRPPSHAELHPVLSAAALFLILGAGLLNWREADPIGTHYAFGDGAEIIDRIGYQVGISQPWDMFSPNPASEDGWYEIVGTTAHGDKYSLPNGDSYRPTGRNEASASYVSQRWRKLLFDYYRTDAFAQHRAEYGAYLWNDWNRRHPDRPLQSIEIAIHHEPTPEPGVDSSLERRILLTYEEPPLHARRDPTTSHRP
ncbi:MAG: HTTM domain-containing protein [Bacteroidota bacterium]